MIFKRSNRWNQNGFSLLEIIVTLVVAALFGTLFIQYMGTSLTKSAEPLINLKATYEAGRILERMTADYRRLLITDTDPLATFKSWIKEGNDSENSPYYGAYTIQAYYFLFDGEGNEVKVEDEDEDDEEKRILKVAVTSGGKTLTALFTN
jgi:prepilin-type N-terminal cleavage/methylation domain-containing protein